MFGRGYEPPVAGRPSQADRLGAIARSAGMAVCGNNCMGYISVVAGLKVSGNPPPIADRIGHAALVSHSGSTWSGLVGNQRDLHFNYAISAGQEIATGLADYIRFLLEQPETRVIACVMETVREPERFLDAVELADERGVPIVALKLGRSEIGKTFALAHSGALSGSNAAYEAVFERHNVIAVQSLAELTDTVELLASPRRPPARGLGIVNDSGGERELIVDVASDVGCPIAELSDGTSRRLAAVLDPGMAPVNPVDSYGDGRTLIGECLEVVAEDPGVGVVALATNLVHGRPYCALAGAVIERIAAGTEKPTLLFGNLHSAISRPEATRLRSLGVPVLMGTESALAAIRHFFDWHFREKLPQPESSVAAGVAERWRERLSAARGKPLDSAASLRLFADFGGAVVTTRPARSESEALGVAASLGFPVVLKTAAAEVLHKSDQGGVVLGIADAESLGGAYRRMADRFGPEVLLQPQLGAGVEILLGMNNDEQFGPMVTFGLGGIFTEILGDVVTVKPPVAAATALRCLERLEGYPLLRGVRGRPPVDLAALALAIERFSLLCVAVGPALAEMDINPLIATGNGAVAVDALAIPKPVSPGGSER